MAAVAPVDEASALRFIRLCGLKLEVGQEAVGTAQVFFLKFGATQPRLSGHDVQAVACACVLLACKVAEEPRRIRSVLNVAHDVRDPAAPAMRLDERYRSRKDAVVLHEQLVLRAIAFDTYVRLPYRHVLNYARTLRASSVVVQLATGLLNDTMYTTRLCLNTSPPILAAAALYVALRVAKEDLAVPTGRLTWWQGFGVTTAELSSVAAVMLRAHRKEVDAAAPTSAGAATAPTVAVASGT